MKLRIAYIVNVLFNLFFLVFFKFIRIKPVPDTLLILRVDAIGDYVLFRNFLKVVRESEIYKNYKITLCGNKEWKELSLEFDSKYYDDSFWINCSDYTNNPIYRFRTIWHIRKKGFETVIHPTYSRVFHFDNLVKLSGAKYRIGSSGDTINQPKLLKNVSDNFYTLLIEATNDVIFEFFRNKEFFEKLLKADLSSIKLKMEITKGQHLDLPEKYVVIFPGAKADFRKYPAKSFAQIIDYIFKYYEMVSVISGDKNDIEFSNIITNNVINKNSFCNMSGKTTLIDLIQIINKAQLLISNETLSVHMAASLNTATICISNGNHIFRFNNYPLELSKNIITIYPDEIESNLNNKEYLINNYYNKRNLDINLIPVNRVLLEIENNFNLK